MKISPRNGYILVSNQDIIEEKKSGSIILPGEEKKKTYLKVESDGIYYTTGQCVFAQPFKTKMQIDENLFLISEDDIVASFTLLGETICTECQNKPVLLVINEVVDKFKFPDGCLDLSGDDLGAFILTLAERLCEEFPLCVLNAK